VHELWDIVRFPEGKKGLNCLFFFYLRSEQILMDIKEYDQQIILLFLVVRLSCFQLKCTSVRVASTGEVKGWTIPIPSDIPPASTNTNAPLKLAAVSMT